MRSGTGPSESPARSLISIQFTLERLGFSFFRSLSSFDLPRSTATRYAIGVSLLSFYLPSFSFFFFFLRLPPPSAHSLRLRAPRDDDARENRNRPTGRASYYLHSAVALSVFPLAIAILARASPRFVSEELHRVDLR